MNDAFGQRINRPFWSRGTRLSLLPLGLGLAFTAIRLLFGLTAITNLTNQYPWGLWVAFDIASGIALAAGGFMTAAFIEIFGRERYRPLLRTALLTAWLGYLMESVILVLDLGRYWNIGQVFLHWQGHSVLFEIALCVISYILVLTVELSPVFAAGLGEGLAKKEKGYSRLRRWQKLLAAVPRLGAVIIPFFVLAGVVLSCMHQSSLGALLVIAPGKVHPLWYTPWLPVLFLLSAAMVGFPMVIIQYLASSRIFRRKPDMGMMDGFAGKIPWLIGLYTTAKLFDLFARRQEIPWPQSKAKALVLLAEMIFGLLIPFLMLIRPRVRQKPGPLFLASMLLAGGVIFNRLNVFLIGYNPPYAAKAYFPALGEIALTAASISAVILFYRFLVIRFPILDFGVAHCDTNGGQNPELCPGDNFRHSRPRLLEKGERRAEGSSLDAVSCGAPGTRQGNRIWRGVAIVSLLGIAVFYSLVHRRALSESTQPPLPTSGSSMSETPFQEKFPRQELFPLTYQDVYTLAGPILNQPDDRFGPVSFSHRRHDVNVDGNCAVCHHRVSFSDDNRSGQELIPMHRMIGVALAGSCLTCHQDLREKKIQKCAACHQKADEADDRSRPGLMAAYHLNCLGCHLSRTDKKNAPTGCNDCHQPRRI